MAIRSEFMSALKQVATERGIATENIIETLQRAMLAAYRKDYPENAERIEEVVVEIDKDSGEVSLNLDGNDVTPPGFGRIAAQTAKQVILQGVREAEKSAVIDEFRNKIGKVVPGVLQRSEKSTWLVDVGRTVAEMPREEQVFGEDYRHNLRLKVFIKEIIETEVRDSVIVSRADKNLVNALFEIEVPEIQSHAVEIKNVSREPGSRSKVAVASMQDGVDPVGSMVGQRGVRVQAVTNELSGEKMDIILWSGHPESFIVNSLAPAQVIDVEIDEERKTAKVEVNDDQLSLAIGKDGQNVRLASKLTGYKIDIVSSSGQKLEGRNKNEEKTDTAEGESDLTGLGLSTRTLNNLKASGINSVDELKLLTTEQLKETPGIGPKAIEEIQTALA